MFSWLARAAAACIGPVLQFRPSSKDEDDRDDSLLWSRDLCPHSAGEFSIGVVQANECIEDHSQVETGSAGTFVGIYDGHGGPEASCFVLDHLFPHLMSEFRGLEFSSSHSLMLIMFLNVVILIVLCMPNVASISLFFRLLWRSSSVTENPFPI